MRQKIHAAVEARRGDDTLIIARTDAHAGHGLQRGEIMSAFEPGLPTASGTTGRPPIPTGHDGSTVCDQGAGR